MSTAATVPQTINPPKKPEPCSVIPHIPPITIPTPFGVDIKSLVDPSKGPPSDCALVHSLMLQLTPMLAGFSCILKILNLVAAIKKALTATPPLIGGISDLSDAIAKMSDCIGLVNPAPWLGMIKAILLMIVAYLGCLIQGFESIRRLKVGIDLNAEGGTPVLLNTLDCAQNNGDTSLAALMSAMEPVQPLLQLLDLIGGIVGIPLGIPSLSATQSGEDPLQPIIDIHDKLQEIAETIPG